jgi:hypothetical protein
MRTPFVRKQLSAAGLLHTARQVLGKIPDTTGNTMALVDHLMSGLALFGLKYPSLLQFEHDRRDETTRANREALYGIERAPSDTRFRERLDALDPSHLRPLYKTLFAQLQRGKGLEGFAYLDDHYLISVDGTGYFSSSKRRWPPTARPFAICNRLIYGLFSAPSRAIMRSCLTGWRPVNRPPRRASATRRDSATASVTSTSCR